MSSAIIAITYATVAFVVLHGVDGLDNGLALTPPMGWLAWQRYRCITDCETYPDECVRYTRLNLIIRPVKFSSNIRIILQCIL